MSAVCGECGVESPTVDHRCGNVVLTPSERALAKMLAAWEEWPGQEEPTQDKDENERGLLLIAFANLLDRFTTDDGLSDEGRDLLSRARRAGVL